MKSFYFLIFSLTVSGLVILKKMFVIPTHFQKILDTLHSNVMLSIVLLRKGGYFSFRKSIFILALYLYLNSTFFCPIFLLFIASFAFFIGECVS